jgi:hypothetical protein
MTHDELLEKIIGMSKKHAEWVPLLDDLLTDKTKALRAVVELHKPYKTKHYIGREDYLACYHCEEATIEGYAYQLPYPCPTIQAIEKELA